MFKLIIIAIIQSGFLAVAQYYMKVGMDRVGEYNLSLPFFKSFLNWQLGLAAFLYIVGMIIYMFLLKNYKLSVIYPLTSISYIFTMLLAMLFLGETIPMVRWVGVFFVMLGVGMIAR